MIYEVVACHLCHGEGRRSQVSWQYDLDLEECDGCAGTGWELVATSAADELLESIYDALGSLEAAL